MGKTLKTPQQGSKDFWIDQYFSGTRLIKIKAHWDLAGRPLAWKLPVLIQKDLRAAVRMKRGAVRRINHWVQSGLSWLLFGVQIRASC